MRMCTFTARVTNTKESTQISSVKPCKLLLNTKLRTVPQQEDHRPQEAITVESPNCSHIEHQRGY